MNDKKLLNKLEKLERFIELLENYGVNNHEGWNLAKEQLEEEYNESNH